MDARTWTVSLLVALLIMGSGCGGRKRPVPAPDTSSQLDNSSSSHYLQFPAAPSLIRIGLATELGEVHLNTAGPAMLQAGEQREKIADLAAGVQVEVQPRKGRLRWQAGDHSGEAVLLFLEPNDPGHLVSWQDKSYRGAMLVLPTGKTLTLVNIVELEAYLRGVVPWEIGRPGPAGLAAVEAQAVAARTYTISHLGERAAFGFDVWADVQDQVYRGSRDEDEICNDAISNTAGLILSCSDHQVEAYYSSTCGGWTSNVEEVWPRSARSYLRCHRDALGEGEPFCAQARHFAWQVVWDGSRLENIVARTLPEYVAYMAAEHRSGWAGETFTPRFPGASYRKPGKLRSLAIVSRTESGRVGRLDVTTDAGVYHVRGDRVRWVLTPPDGQPVILRSALFALDVECDRNDRPTRITARGHGFGHGVGMCQEGALAMARQGYSSEDILFHYYPGTRLEPVNGQTP
jgi:stage II sporulation protein D